MIKRCYYPKHKSYHQYGAKGISVCDEWRNSYVTFREWALKNGYNDVMTIDRIDNSGNYEPNNCRWITMKEQQSNRTDNVFIDIDGEKVTLTKLSETIGISVTTLHSRYHVGQRGISLIRKPYAPKQVL